MPLSHHLRAEIARRGPIPFRDFMERALYDPAHGYYAAGRARIGRAGDFFTNVSVGSLFGQMLAAQFEEMWERLGCPLPFTIVEQGAHHGDFARDVLSELHLYSPILHERIDYVIVEPSPAAADAQRARLATFDGRVRWVSALDELDPFTGIHFSNELLDAFPVHLVTWTGTEWLERHVAADGERFVFTDLPLSTPALGAHLANLPAVPGGYITEVNLAALDWLTALSAKLVCGFIFAIDYGYPRDLFYAPDRTSGTLSAYADHRREPDPLARPGEIDLTAHVDFTSLAEHAASLGLTLAGFTDQHHLMVGLGRLHFGDAAPSPEALRQFKTLMHPELMGRSFHAICFAREVAAGPPLAGFQFAREPRAALGIG
jgi:SAM-dependent MidA family methyltransferase